MPHIPQDPPPVPCHSRVELCARYPDSAPPSGATQAPRDIMSLCREVHSRRDSLRWESVGHGVTGTGPGCSPHPPPPAGANSPALARARGPRARASRTTARPPFVSLHERPSRGLSRTATARSPPLCRRKHQPPPTVQIQGLLPWGFQGHKSQRPAGGAGPTSAFSEQTIERGRRPSE